MLQRRALFPDLAPLHAAQPTTSHVILPLLLPQVDWLHRLPTTHLVAFYLKYLCDAFQ